MALARAHDTIKAALDMFDQAAASEQAPPSRASLQQAAERLKGETAKVGILYSTDGTVGPDEAASILEALSSTVLAFCSCCHAATAGAGPSLRKEIRKAANAAVKPCLGLVKALDVCSSDDVKRQVALIWEGCDALARWPLDNKSCLFRCLAGALAVLQDTQREMADLQQQQQQQQQHDPPDGDAPAHDTHAAAANGLAAAGAGCGGIDGGAAASALEEAAEDASMADLDYEPEALSQQEARALAACSALVDAAAATLKTVSRTLLEGPALSASGNPDALEQWENCCFHAGHLRRCVEDLGAAMYPPQDLEEVQSAGTSTADVLEMMLDECPVPDALGPQLGVLQQQFGAARQQLQHVLGLEEAG